MKPLDEVTSAILLHGCAVVRHRRPIPPEQPPGDGTGEFTDESTLDVPRNPTVRPAWTLRQTTGEPSGLYEAQRRPLWR